MHIAEYLLELSGKVIVRRNKRWLTVDNNQRVKTVKQKKNIKWEQASNKKGIQSDKIINLRGHDYGH